MSLKIEKNIKLQKKPSAIKKFTVTLKKLKIGESFVISVDRRGNNGNHRTVIAAAQVLLDRVYVTRRESNDVVRIYRVI